jgi:hypothetical protein
MIYMNDFQIFCCIKTKKFKALRKTSKQSVTMANPAYALDVTPESELTFNLSRSNDVTSRVNMTLHHPGNTDDCLAFKVRLSIGSNDELLFRFF